MGDIKRIGKDVELLESDPYVPRCKMHKVQMMSLMDVPRQSIMPPSLGSLTNDQTDDPYDNEPLVAPEPKGLSAPIYHGAIANSEKSTPLSLTSQKQIRVEMPNNSELNDEWYDRYDESLFHPLDTLNEIKPGNISDSPDSIQYAHSRASNISTDNLRVGSLGKNNTVQHLMKRVDSSFKIRTDIDSAIIKSPSHQL